jgi:ribonuclease HI
MIMKVISVYTDGGARGNPGPAAIGYVISHDDTIVAEKGIYIGDSVTNNWAEYEALYLALKHMCTLGLNDYKVHAYLDSLLVVEQIGGRWKIKEPALKIQHAKVRELIDESFIHFACSHIPREQNKRADMLVNQALDAHLQK